MRIAIFGAGIDGKTALSNIGAEKVDCFIDNYKSGEKILGIPVYSLNEAKEKLDLDNTLVLIASSSYCNEMRKQCRENSIPWFSQYFPMDHSSISNKERLNADEWERLMVFEEQTIIENISNSDKCSEWTKEMLKITKPSDSVLEIGCGSGETSLVLAKNNRKVTALDYSLGTVEMVERVSKSLGITLDTICFDATKELPFSTKFDYVFQAGLLEHFYTEQRIDMLKKWKKCADTMVSLIPNANSVGYRIGKQISEDNGTWEFGLEMPQGSLKGDFEAAGIEVTNEYTIDSYGAVRFLPKDHILRVALEKMMEQYDLDKFGQGYLLVTIGKC